MIDRHIEVLEEFVTKNRRTRMQNVLNQRTRFATVVLEDIYQPHNASAVLRTCDAFGVQDVHIVEDRNRYRVNPGVELGTSQWLTLHRYAEGIKSCFHALRTRGYRIVATSPNRGEQTLKEFDINAGPFALAFGTEKEGLSETALTSADEYLRIPIVGFVESFNISVSAALILYELTDRLRSSRLSWELSEREKIELYFNWLKGSVRNADQILEQRSRAND